MEFKQFTREDLKCGMLVETRRGDIYCVINNTLVSNRGFMFLDSYDNDDLKEWSGQKDFDIIRVSKQLSNKDLAPMNWTKHKLHQNLLWERSETIQIDGKEYRKEDVLDRIKELTPIR